VWFDNTTETNEPPDHANRLAKATGDYLPHLQELDHLLESNYPTDPHWHLAFIAVESTQWGHRHGSALLNYKHARLDDQGVAAYLEGTNHNNQRLYCRHGYADMDPSTMLLSDGTPFYRMWSPAAH